MMSSYNATCLSIFRTATVEPFVLPARECMKGLKDAPDWNIVSRFVDLKTSCLVQGDFAISGLKISCSDSSLHSFNEIAESFVSNLQWFSYSFQIKSGDGVIFRSCSRNHLVLRQNHMALENQSFLFCEDNCLYICMFFSLQLPDHHLYENLFISQELTFNQSRNQSSLPNSEDSIRALIEESRYSQFTLQSICRDLSFSVISPISISQRYQELPFCRDCLCSIVVENMHPNQCITMISLIPQREMTIVESTIGKPVGENTESQYSTSSGDHAESFISNRSYFRLDYGCVHIDFITDISIPILIPAGEAFSFCFRIGTGHRVNHYDDNSIDYVAGKYFTPFSLSWKLGDICEKTSISSVFRDSKNLGLLPLTDLSNEFDSFAPNIVHFSFDWSLGSVLLPIHQLCNPPLESLESREAYSPLSSPKIAMAKLLFSYRCPKTVRSLIPFTISICIKNMESLQISDAYFTVDDTVMK